MGSPAPSPCVWRDASRTPRFSPYPRVTAAKHCVSTTRSATLRGPLRQATAKSAIHTVVPWKKHLSRFDPLKRPPPGQRQTACKPGSVPPHGSSPGDGDGHSSGTLVAERLVRPTRAAARRPARHPGSLRNARRSYLVLLPVGFSLPPPLPAARCALTAPFHPCRPPARPRQVGGVLSVALSLGSPPPGVTRHRTSVEPGLSSLRAPAESGHPTVWQ